MSEALLNDGVNEVDALSDGTSRPLCIMSSELWTYTADWAWDLEKWPFDKVDDNLQQDIINEGHWVVQPLAAYTASEELITPANYKKEVAGTIVMMSFRLKYALPSWNTVSNKKDKLQ